MEYKADVIRSQFEAIIDGCDDAIVSKTLDGIITNWNRGAEVIYGYSAAEVIGQSVSILIPSDSPDEMPDILKKIASGEKISRYETIRLRKDGQKVNVSLSISPIRNDNREIVGAATIGRDITERKHAEVEREKLISELREALDKVKTLSGFLPICASCKRIRDDYGYWHQIEKYIHDHSEVQFSHGLCKECAEKLYPGLDFVSITEPQNRKIILCADDDPDDRLLIRDAFDAIPSDVFFTVNGFDLLDYLRHQGKYADGNNPSPKPDIILLDLNMPRMDGRKALQQIKADSELRDIPVIILTTSSTREDVMLCYDLGANSFISKPTDFDQIVRITNVFFHYWMRATDLPKYFVF